MKKIPPKLRPFFIYIALTLGAAALLLLAARTNGSFAEWYARHIYPLFPHTLGRLCSLLPFSLFEVILLALSVSLASGLIYGIISLLSPAGRIRLWRQGPWLLPRLAALLSSLLLIFTLTCGINYSRAPLAYYLGLERKPASTQELLRLYDILCAQGQELAPLIETDAEGYFLLSNNPPAEQARQAMQELNRRYDGFISYYPRPKPVIFSTIMSRLHISGIFSPFTIEANYNQHMPPSAIPFTICHELGHLSGFMSEDEANFVGYLACLYSQEKDFQYSGNFYGLIYVLNALYTVVTPEQYAQLYEKLPPQIRADMQKSSAYWRSFEGRAARLSEQVNDIYLKANSQAQGVRSYDMMVDLLLAYYREK